MIRKLLIFSLLITLLSCKKRNDEINSENFLNIPLREKIDTLDPSVAYDQVSGMIVGQVYESLFEYHYLKRPLTLQPALAETMPLYSEDKKTLTVKIKKNVRYHQDPSFKGKPRYIEAQDFVTSIKRIAYKPTLSKGWWIFRNKVIGLDKFREEASNSIEKFQELQIEGLQTPDKHTLVIKLKTIDPQFLFALAMPFTSPIPMESVLHHNNNFSRIVVGTGPYTIEKFNNISGATLKKFEHFRDDFYPSKGDRFAHENGLLKDAGKKLPLSDGINFYVLNEAQPRWLNFLSKKIDFMKLTKDNFSTAVNRNGTISDELKKQNVELEISPTLTYWWLAFNMDNVLLNKNKKLRQAIAHAVDIDKYIKLFTKNLGQKAHSVYTPGIPGYDPKVELPYKYDLEKAKKLLAEAGYPGGKSLPSLDFDLRGTNTTSRQRGEFIKSQLEKIGIHINIKLNSFPTYLHKEAKGKLNFWLGGWALDYPDAENILQLLHSSNKAPGPNASNYANAKVDKLIDRIKLMENTEEKFQLMKEVEQQFQKDLPWVLLFYERLYHVKHNYLRNYRHSDIIQNRFKYLKLIGK